MSPTRSLHVTRRLAAIVVGLALVGGFVTSTPPHQVAAVPGSGYCKTVDERAADMQAAMSLFLVGNTTEETFTNTMNSAQVLGSAFSVIGNWAPSVGITPLVMSLTSYFKDLYAASREADAIRLKDLLSEARIAQLNDEMKQFSDFTKAECYVTPLPATSPSPTPGKTTSPSPTPGKTTSPSPTPGKTTSPSPTPATKDYVRLNKTSWQAGKGKASLKITATSGARWTATSDSSWLTVKGSPGRSGTQFTLSVAKNLGPSRTAHVTVRSGGASTTLTVSQKGGGSVKTKTKITLTPNRWTPNRPAATKTFTVTVSTGVAWSAQSKNPWIHVVQQTATQLTLSVDKAPNSSQRRGKVVVTAGTKTKTITVRQG